MIDAIRLKEVVRSNIPRLAEALYPNGKFHYGEWRVGNVAGDPSDSLGIRLIGSKAGLGIDRASGEAGDFIYFVRGKYGFSFREAVEWVGRTLGVSSEISDNDGEEAGEKETLSGSGSKLESEPLGQPEPVPLTGAQLKRMALAAHRLALAPGKIFSVLGSGVKSAATRCAAGRWMATSAMRMIVAFMILAVPRSCLGTATALRRGGLV